MKRPDRSLLLSATFHLVLVAAFAFGFHWPNEQPASATAVSIKAVAIDQSVIDAQTDALDEAQRQRDEAAQEALRERQREEAARDQAEKVQARLAKLEQQREREEELAQEAERKAQQAREREEQRRLKAEEDKKAAAAQAEKDRVAALQKKQAEEKRIAAEKRAAAEEQKRLAEEKRKAEAEAKRVAEEKRKAEAEAKRLAEEKRKAEAEKKRLAEEKRKADAEAKRKAAAAAAAAKKKAAQDAREAQLSEMLAMEEQRMTAVDGGLLNEYMAMLQQTLRRNWNRPSSAPDDLKCTVIVTQIIGGDVIDVQIKSCNGDKAVAQSVERAVYKSSPLPEPPDPSLFERVLEIVFVPPKSR